MDKHYGNLVERIIRRNDYSISELARITHVSRSSIYKWFNQRDLRPDIIFRIGCALKHDFSIEFPELFSSDEFQKAFNSPSHLEIEAPPQESDEQKPHNYWKDKYIRVLEEYIEFCKNQTQGSNINETAVK